MSILCRLSSCSESDSQTWQALGLTKISRWMCYNVCTTVLSYLCCLLDFPSPLVLIYACKVQECVLYEAFFCRFIISYCLFWQKFISTPHIDCFMKPVSLTQPSGVPGLCQRSLNSLQEHRLAAAPAGSCISQCQTAGAGRRCPWPPSPPQFGNPDMPSPFSLAWEDCLCPGDWKIKVD